MSTIIGDRACSSRIQIDGLLRLIHHPNSRTGFLHAPDNAARNVTEPVPFLPETLRFLRIQTIRDVARIGPIPTEGLKNPHSGLVLGRVWWQIARRRRLSRLSV
jgi:hypothetical protein